MLLLIGPFPFSLISFCDPSQNLSPLCNQPGSSHAVLSLVRRHRSCHSSLLFILAHIIVVRPPATLRSTISPVWVAHQRSGSAIFQTSKHAFLSLHLIDRESSLCNA